jgi:hypothetical protein
VAEGNLTSPAAVGACSVVSQRRLLQDPQVQGLIGYQFLQLGILSFQILQAPDLVHFQTRVPLLPSIERLLGNPHLADQLRHRPSHLSLLQRPDHLFHRRSLPLHGKTSSPTPGFCRELTFKVDQKMGDRSERALSFASVSPSRGAGLAGDWPKKSIEKAGESQSVTARANTPISRRVGNGLIVFVGGRVLGKGLTFQESIKFIERLCETLGAENRRV